MSDKKLDLILAEVQGIKSEVQHANQRLDKIDNRLDQHEGMLAQLIQIVGSTNAKLEELTEDVNILKMNQQTVLNIQQEQQKILERLSVRSISHEADIAELRRIK